MLPSDYLVEGMALYTSESILRRSAVTSLINTTNPGPLAAKHAHAITLSLLCSTDDRPLLIVDFSSVTLASSRVFLTWFDFFDLRFYFNKERILRSSTLGVFGGLPGHLACLCIPVDSFFVGM